MSRMKVVVAVGLALFTWVAKEVPVRAALVYDGSSTDVTVSVGTVVEESQEASYNANFNVNNTPFSFGLTNLVPGQTLIFSSELTGWEATNIMNGDYPTSANDGASNPWLPTSNGTEWVGVAFSAPINNVKYVGFGTQYTNRNAGDYDIQYTTDATANGSSSWTTVGTLSSIVANGTDAVGRHLIDVGIHDAVTGIRIIGTPDTGLGAASISVSELEVYAVPEPHSVALCSIGAAILFLLRKKT